MSWGDVGASVGKRGNIQTRGGNRVSPISLLGCSTSVALTMGPTEEEEEEEEVLQHFNFCAQNCKVPQENRILFNTILQTCLFHVVKFYGKKWL